MTGGIAIGIFSAEVASIIYAAREMAKTKRKEILTYGRRMPRSIPILDAQIQKKAGKSTKMQRVAAKFTVKGIRQMVDTRTFEHLVQMFINQRAEKSKPKVRLCV